MITIVDLGLGNVNSVSRALTYLRVPNVVSRDIKDIETSKKLIFPGVGNFSEASKRLHSTGLREKIREEVLDRGKPLMGICLGMQLLAKEGEEGGVSEGLGLIEAKVSRLRSEGNGYILPHMGWNDVVHNEMKVFSNIEEDACFYFVHSYEMMHDDPGAEYATCDYGVEFVAAVKKNNIIGVQFHPEKSQRAGLQFLKNFVEGVY